MRIQYTLVACLAVPLALCTLLPSLWAQRPNATETPPGWEQREAAQERGASQRDPQVDKRLQEKWDQQREQREIRERERHEREWESETESWPEWLRKNGEGNASWEKRRQRWREETDNINATRRDDSKGRGRGRGRGHGRSSQ